MSGRETSADTDIMLTSRHGESSSLKQVSHITDIGHGANVGRHPTLSFETRCHETRSATTQHKGSRGNNVLVKTMARQTREGWSATNRSSSRVSPPNIEARRSPSGRSICGWNEGRGGLAADQVVSRVNVDRKQETDRDTLIRHPEVRQIDRDRERDKADRQSQDRETNRQMNHSTSTETKEHVYPLCVLKGAKYIVDPVQAEVGDNCIELILWEFHFLLVAFHQHDFS